MTAEIITFPGVQRPTELTAIFEALRPLRGEAKVVATLRAGWTMKELGVRPEGLPPDMTPNLRRLVEMILTAPA